MKSLNIYIVMATEQTQRTDEDLKLKLFCKLNCQAQIWK